MRDIHLRVGEKIYEGSVQSLSKYGALIQTISSLPVGVGVTMMIDAREGGSVAVQGTIIMRIDSARAARLGVAPGIAVRYPPEENAAFEQLAREVAHEPQRRKRSTQPIIAPILKGLVTASRRDDGVKVAMSGNLEDVDCGTLCSALERMRRTGQLRLQQLDSSAELDFLDGEIVRVRSSWEHAPRRILFEVLGWNFGTFELRSTPVIATQSHRGMRVTPLLLERTK